MKNRRHTTAGIMAAIAMLIIILDGKTAMNSMMDGITLCVKTVIPALFPFFLLSGLITNCLLGGNLKAFRLLGRICKLPKGSESILVVGLLSGYPMGAQLVAQAYRDKKISIDAAERMLGFCSNAGPAFIFGMLSSVFESPIVPLLLWLIQMLSALMVSFLLPARQEQSCKINNANSNNITADLNRAIKNMALVCGWVLLFRVVLGYCERWFLWIFPADVKVLFCGLLELSNGCAMLLQITSESIRFLFACVMLSFGGLCVMMQTQSVTQDLGTGYYFPGKVLQTLLSAALSIIAIPLIFPNNTLSIFSVTATLCLLGVLTLLFYILFRKKVVAIGRRMLYNTGS